MFRKPDSAIAFTEFRLKDVLSSHPFGRFIPFRASSKAVPGGFVYNLHDLYHDIIISFTFSLFFFIWGAPTTFQGYGIE